MGLLHSISEHPSERASPPLVQYPRWVDRDCTLREVGPGLFVGDWRSPGLARQIPFKLVVRMTAGSALQPVRSDGSTARILHAPMNDGDALDPATLDAIDQEIRDALPRGPVLIHCQAGLSRSASVAYAMLRRIFGRSHQAAYSAVKAHANYPLRTTLDSARQWVHDRHR